MEYVAILGEWLGIDALAYAAQETVETAMRSPGPVRWVIGGVALVVVGFLIGRLLGGGRL